MHDASAKRRAGTSGRKQNVVCDALTSSNVASQNILHYKLYMVNCREFSATKCYGEEEHDRIAGCKIRLWRRKHWPVSEVCCVMSVAGLMLVSVAWPGVVVGQK